jgi:hypothetical protein
MPLIAKPKGSSSLDPKNQEKINHELICIKIKNVKSKLQTKPDIAYVSKFMQIECLLIVFDELSNNT